MLDGEVKEADQYGRNRLRLRVIGQDAALERVAKRHPPCRAPD